MAQRVFPYHSKSGQVYHIYKVCSAGGSIRKDRIVKGKGNKKLCRECNSILNSPSRGRLLK